jgi:hypothetical protein
MPSKTVIGSRYDDTFNTKPMHGICCCIHYIWPLATKSRLLHTCTVHLPLHAYSAEGGGREEEKEKKNKVMLWRVTLTRLC